MARHTYGGTPLTAENVRTHQRIRERHPQAQDRFIVRVVDGVYIQCNGVVSGRSSAIAWERPGRHTTASESGA